MAISKVNPDQLIFTGKELTFLTPSNNLVTVREINGEDEDTLSKVGNARGGKNLIKFLARLVTGIQGHTGPITDATIMGWKSRDIYYTLYKARIHSMGYRVTFSHTFQGTEEAIGFEEDLEIFDWDFSMGRPPLPGEDGYDERVIQPYPEIGNPYMEGKTTSGKIFRMKYLTGEMEMGMLDVDPDDLSLNDKLRIRGFELQLPNGQWTPIDNFAAFAWSDMRDFRKIIDTYDGDFALKIKITHPRKKITEEISLFSLADFFFPTV